jgi:hypothetical protein
LITAMSMTSMSPASGPVALTATPSGPFSGGQRRWCARWCWWEATQDLAQLPVWFSSVFRRVNRPSSEEFAAQLRPPTTRVITAVAATKPANSPACARAFPARKGDTIFRGAIPPTRPIWIARAAQVLKGHLSIATTERYLRSTTSRSAQPCCPRCAGVAALEGEVAERGDQCVGDRGGCAVDAGH